VRVHAAGSGRALTMLEDSVVDAVISHAPEVVAAFQRIADSGQRFVSRGDESGTHERERRLWSAAGRTPANEKLLVSGPAWRRRCGTPAKLAATC